MKLTKTEKIRNQINSHISKIEICGYLIDEIDSFLGYMHYYKLINILKNIDLMIDYLKSLDNTNTQEIKKIILNKNKTENRLSNDKELSKDSLNGYYYLSRKGYCDILEQTKHIDIENNLNEIEGIMLGIRGSFLLISSEFCNATMTRMYINKIKLEKTKNILNLCTS